ncbi:beta-mannosidase, partial [Rhizobium ruizarguesonis]
MDDVVIASCCPSAELPRAVGRTATPDSNRPVVTKESITFGDYDPNGDLGASPNSKIEHLFLTWEDVDLSTLALADD